MNQFHGSIEVKKTLFRIRGIDTGHFQKGYPYDRLKTKSAKSIRIFSKSAPERGNKSAQARLAIKNKGGFWDATCI